MTLTSETNRVQYSGDGSTTVFPITFVFWSAADIQVIHTDANGTDTTWTRGTQYSQTGGDGSTGSITVDTSPTDYTPAAGETLTIRSNLDDTQPLDLPEGGALPSSALEQQLDKMVRLIQQRSEELGRAVKLKVSSAFSALTMPEPEADRVIGWNAAADDLENKTPNDSAYLTTPGSATDNAIVLFDGTTGRSFKEGTPTFLPDATDIFAKFNNTGVEQWTVKYENIAAMGSVPMLSLTADANDALKMYLASVTGGTRLYLWDDSVTLPDIPHTGIKPTFAVHGDILVGDIVALASNPMTYFVRANTGLAASATTQLFSAQNGVSDTDGGAQIVYAPFTGGAVSDGFVSLIAYGGGSGTYANAIRLQRRTAADTVSDTGHWTSSGHYQPGAENTYDWGQSGARIREFFGRRVNLGTASESQIYAKRALDVSVTAYATVLTISPSAVTGRNLRGFVRATIGGHTSTVANGALHEVVWYFDIANAAPTVASVAAGTSSGTGAPAFRLSVSGNDILVQIQSSDGVNNYSGLAVVEVFAPAGAGIAAGFTLS